MKTLLKSKLSYLLLFFFSINNTLQAQWDCDGDCEGGGTPPTPPGQGTGSPATPIDEYTIYLIGFAIAVAVVYFAMNKYKKSLI
ncbi:hypothetical protein OBK27_04545 [Empedobacter falsenii]